MTGSGFGFRKKRIAAGLWRSGQHFVKEKEKLVMMLMRGSQLRASLGVITFMMLPAPLPRSALECASAPSVGGFEWPGQL